ncbi:MAG TPA: hypothetical protein VNW15_14785 [Rhizomicrobium sp.]|jgi:hypothetical protein|nr:hypothetical protein [Rhizomicrobium sp.]
MILSKKHNFIFIKGMKVAGTSVEMALSILCGPEDIITPISQVDELERLKLGGRCQNYSASREAEGKYLERLRAAPPDQIGQVPEPAKRYFSHISLGAAALLYGGDISGFRIVCVERSPYAKVISWANMQLSYDNYSRGGTMQADPKALKAAVDKGLASGEIRHARNIERYRGADGTVIARPMRYAQLAADFGDFVRSLGEDVPVLPHAKKGLMSDRLDPRKVFRPDQIARINALFADEFTTFGYETV